MARDLSAHRLVIDVAEIGKMDEGIIMLSMDEENMSRMEVLISGPVATPYESGLFHVLVNIPKQYPFDPPKMKFVTKVWHPNVSCSGKLCVDVLYQEWRAATTLLEALEAVQGLLANPNPGSPLNPDAALMMLNDADMYRETVVLWTKCFAGATESYRYVDGLLDDVVHAYNHTYHSSIKMRLVDVMEDRVLEVYYRLQKSLRSRRRYSAREVVEGCCPLATDICSLSC